jgi:hypothetical protein
MGNHEYYGNIDMTTTEREFRTLGTTVPGVIPMLNNTVYLRDPVDNRLIAFHGTTLWSALEPPPKEKINDFCRIKIIDPTTGQLRCWRPDESYQKYQQNVTWVDSAIDKNKDIVNVVISHHAPLAYGTYSPDYNDSPTLGNFVSNLGWLIEKHAASLQLWVFGHTHYKCDLAHAGVRVVSNPLGYTNENTGYEAGFVVEV